MASVGRVGTIRRYPVKAMDGEQLESAAITAHGIQGDRLWAVRDVGAGAIVGGRRLPILLECAARYAAPPGPDAGPGCVPYVVVRLPDGREIASDDPGVNHALSELAGRELELHPLPARWDRARFGAPRQSERLMKEDFGLAAGEGMPDFSVMPLRKLAVLSRNATDPGTFFDAYPVHVLTTASLEAVSAREPGALFDPRRFRPNLLVATPGATGFVETAWCGGGIRAGAVDLDVAVPTIRCAVPSRAQRELPADPRVLRAVVAHAGRCLGVYASVARAGVVRIGDEVTILRPARHPWALTLAIRRLLLRVGTALSLARE